MAKDIVTKAEILGGEIDVRANFGQTVKVTVSPDPYMGDTEVTPSAEIQVLATKDKTVRSDIVINPAPTESLATSENGTFIPSSGNVGFSEVVVDVEPSLESLSVTENGLYLPETGVDGFDRVTVDVPPTIPDLVPLDVTANGQYLPTGHDGFSEVNVNVPTGGGGGLTLLDTIEVNGVNGVQVDIDATWFDDADYVSIVPNVVASASDWPYVTLDSTTGGAYASRTPVVDSSYGIVLIKTESTYRGVWFRKSVAPVNVVPQSYVYLYMYYAPTTMTGTIKIYGIKVT